MSDPQKMSAATADVLFSPQREVSLGELWSCERRIFAALAEVDDPEEAVFLTGCLVRTKFVPPAKPELVWDDCPCPSWPEFDYTVPEA